MCTVIFSTSMKRIYVFVLLNCLVSVFVQAQTNFIFGTVINKTNEPLIGASILVLRPSDSTSIKGGIVDIEGNFKIENIQQEGIILIKFSYIGYQDLFKKEEIAGVPLNLGTIILKEQSSRLAEVDITATLPPVIQKEDTTQIDAKAFKTNPDANAEDLVTKMPGITVQNGKVQAQGEDVKKVLVDGKEFFGDDANAVLKNLPAQIIDKVQIFDKLSTQSELTGFDDGNTSKTINIVTKQEFRNGTFGRASVAYGYNDKWAAGMNLNLFNDKRRFTILGNSNNINQQNFSSEDLVGVSGGGGRRGGGKFNNNSNFFSIDQKSGITTTNAFGLNYSESKEGLELSGSYFLNLSNNLVQNNLYRQYITGGNQGLEYLEDNRNESGNINHRINMKADWKIDSVNRIIIQPKLSFQQNNGDNPQTGRNLQGGAVLSSSKSDFNSDLAGANLSLPITYRRSFAKKKRAFSIEVTPNYSGNNGNSSLLSQTGYFSDSLFTNEINQKIKQSKSGLSLSSNVLYTEPVGEKGQLMFKYTTNLNQNYADKQTNNYNPLEKEYTYLDTTLSNRFDNNYQSHAAGISYRFKQEKWNLNTGLSYQYALLNADQIYPRKFEVNKSFISLLPTLQFRYKFSKKKYLNIAYRSNNSAPSVNQLQNVINNDNPLQLSTGNPYLKQDRENLLTVRYTTSNTEKLSSFFSLISFKNTQDYIVKNTIIANQDSLIAPGIILAKGGQISKPVNSNGYYNLRLMNNFSFMLTKLKLNFNVNLGGGYTRMPGIINNRNNFSNSYNAGFGLSVNSNISERVDFSLNSFTTYNNVSNTLQENLNSNYYNQASSFRVQVMPFKGFIIQTDLNHQFNNGLSKGFNQSYLLWNAAVGYKFLKNNLGELRLSVFDIMRQNKNVDRNVTETYYEDVETNALQHYFLLTFSYTVRYFKGVSTKD